MKKTLFAIVFCFALSAPAVAQNAKLSKDLGIQPDELEMVTERIVEKVEDFQRWLQDIAGRGNLSHDTKMKLYNRALKLFIGEGKPYSYTDPIDGKTKTHPAVKMGCISSKYSKERKYPYMTDYLMQLIKKSENPNYRYSQVVIEAADAVRVDNLLPVGDGQYVGTAHILQHFIGFSKDGQRKIYEDYTKKTITIHLNRVEIPTPEGTVYGWDILLGDVDCDDIW